MDDDTSLEELSLEPSSLPQAGSTASINLSIATTDSSSSNNSGSRLSLAQTKVDMVDRELLLLISLLLLLLLL